MKKVLTTVVASALAVFLIWGAAHAAGTSSTLVYTVKPGDTIWKVAKAHGVSMEALLEANADLKNEKNLKAGMVLTIPDASEEIIPVEKEVSETHTLIVHGAGVKTTPVAKSSNVMIVNGKSVKVPTYRPPQKKDPVVVADNEEPDSGREVTTYAGSNYRAKYSNMSSRGYIKSTGIIKAAFKFMGVPYVFGGTTPRGFDCSGFVQYVYRMNGISAPRMAHHQYYAGTPVSRSQLRPGDLVFFETYTKGISHVGIFIGNNKFIHASSSGAVKVSDLTGYYVERYRGACRYY